MRRVNSSGTTIYECHGCNSGRMMDAARSKLERLPGTSITVTIYNLKDNKIRTYQSLWLPDTSCDINPTICDGPPVLTIQEISTNSTIRTAFSEIRSIYVNNGNSLTFYIGHNTSASINASAFEFTTSESKCRPAPESADTAYDFAKSSQVRNRTYAKVVQDLGFRFKVFLNESVRLLPNLISGHFEKKPFAVYEFEDGGRVLYQHDPVTDLVTHIPGSIADCDENTVPEKKEDVPGDYSFSGSGGGGFGGFNDLVGQRYSYNFSFGGSGGGGDGQVCVVYESPTEIIVTCN